jgi:hypothetical protein
MLMSIFSDGSTLRGVARGYSIAATGIRSLLAFLDSNEYFGHSDQMRQLFAKEYLEGFCFLYRDISPVDEVCSQDAVLCLCLIIN